MTTKEVPSKESPAEEKPEEEEKETIGDLAKTAFLAIILAMMIRTFMFEPFNIPSGSMVPNLLVGDYLFVSKYSYGYSKHSFPFSAGGFEGRVIDGDLPERGDVAVFRLPTNTSIDYIKRVIGLPGDTIQVIGGQLYINKKPAPREMLSLKEYTNDFNSTVEVVEYLETLPNDLMHIMYEIDDYQELDNTKEFTVPEDHYFMMGDNRDNSQDSRVMSQVGFVPIENFIGKAEFVFFSTNGKAKLYEIWKWPFSIRYSRLFNRIK